MELKIPLNLNCNRIRRNEYKYYRFRKYCLAFGKCI